MLGWKYQDYCQHVIRSPALFSLSLDGSPPLSSRFDDISDGIDEGAPDERTSVSRQRRITSKQRRAGKNMLSLVGSRSHFFMDLFPCSAEPLCSILGDIDVLMARASNALSSAYAFRLKIRNPKLQFRNCGLNHSPTQGVNRICNLHNAQKSDVHH